jgi:hypothetical protein
MVQIFRDKDGKPNTAPDSGLRIELKDFACEDLSREVQGFLEIDSATLCGMLEQAEKRYGVWKRKEGFRPSAGKDDANKPQLRSLIRAMMSGE